MPYTFQAPWSKMLKLTTLLSLGILLLAVFATRGPANYVAGGLLIASLLFFIRGYSIQNGQVVIHGLLWSKAYSLAEMVGAEVSPSVTAGSLRAFGNGGMFSMLGYFRNDKLGNYLAFITDSQNAVVLDFPDKRMVVSPDDPEAFVGAVREEYNRSHKWRRNNA
jgi:hypothetical protein